MLPYFHQSELTTASIQQLDADTSHHIAQVLRMQTGERMNLTDGKGNLVEGHLSSVSKKSCTVTVTQRSFHPPQGRKVHLAIAPPKNASRLEWFIEKATELGVASIVPVRTARTEKERLRMDRMQQIAISAMLQSQQVWLPSIPEPMSFAELIVSWKQQSLQRLIAHCVSTDRHSLGSCELSAEVGLLIGPEGDFTSEEIELARNAGFAEVQLGDTRLRTETAGVVGASLLRLRS